jgi:hypothetical protein
MGVGGLWSEEPETRSGETQPGGLTELLPACSCSACCLVT